MRAAVALFVLASLVGCTGTETGNPSFAGMTAASSEPERVAVGDGPGIVIEEAWISVYLLELVEGCGPEDGPLPLREEAFVVDAAGGGLANPFEAPAIPTGSYCRMNVVVRPGAPLPDGAPEELRGKTVLISGRRADGAPFRILSSTARRPDVVGGIDVSADDPAFVMRFDAAAWLDGVGLDTLPVPGGGEPIRIDEDANEPELEQLEQGFDRSLVLFRDEDADGLVDPEEPSVATGE